MVSPMVFGQILGPLLLTLDKRLVSHPAYFFVPVLNFLIHL